MQQLEQCRDALQTYTGPAIRRTVTDGVTVETLVDQRQQTVRDAARIMAALNAERHKVPPQQLRAYYEAAAGYARALQPHTDNQDLVDRTIRAAEHACTFSMSGSASTESDSRRYGILVIELPRRPDPPC